MPFKTVIKWLHRGVTLSLLMVVVAFLWLDYQPDTRSDDVLLRKHALSENLWLYTTSNDSGGATVSGLYRYYLSTEIPGKDNEVLKTLNMSTPFLEGTGSISEANVDAGGKVNITYSGRVFSLSGNISHIQFTVRP